MCLREQLIEQIGRLFPTCLTEDRGEDGFLRRSVDFERLRDFLAPTLATSPETYEFRWVGKTSSLRQAGRRTTKTLRPDLDESVNFEGSENVFITGDNLEVLKILQESYLGAVDMIYIDPPYNRGDDLVYRDNYHQTKAEQDAREGNLDEKGQRLRKNTKTNSRYHSDWLNMIYPRLLLARNLLKDSGVIFISIDDNEQANLKQVCDEVFGQENFIASITRNTNSSKNQSLYISVSHEYCLVYSKDILSLNQKHAGNKWEVNKNNIAEYKKRIVKLQKMGLSSDEITAELKELTKYPRFIDFTNYWYVDKRGVYMKGDLGGVKNGSMQPIINPLTNKEDPVPPGGFRYKTEKLLELINDNRIHFHTDGSLPRIKRYLDENSKQRPKSIMSDDQRPDNKRLKDFGLDFDNPKQLTFMSRILSIFENDSLFMDFFAGSATTADAVMQLNAEDGGKRKYILCTLDEVAESSAAKKAGFDTIDQIARERIRRAANKIRTEQADKADSLDLGFRAFRLAESNFRDVALTPGDTVQGDLLASVNHLREGTSALDLLFQVMLSWGSQLSLAITQQKQGDNTIYTVADGELIACFDEVIGEDTIRSVAKAQPERAVFWDASFANSSDKINLIQIFKELSPETQVKVV
ncbi:site-specific DNA-methyltransferase [Streptococcus sciuri]|uniref:Site-specific DNA-methyltransferase n=1 Tax=Streptococcus sciuri TaxID=2973939 RepID=A0ABT2F6R1_9STRE|nr:site-specific DNA-methyltransferase [Streptococcus sciuri]MCS4488114.1 site-specific DNA-methyltransferase [Streptococcus sciuri]